MVLDQNCPVERYPNLTLLEISSEKRGSPIARVVGRYTQGIRILDVAFDLYSFEQIDWEGPILHVAGFKSKCLIHLTVLKETGTSSSGTRKPGVIMESLIQECHQLLQAGCVSSWVGGMETLTHASSVELLYGDLDTILGYCQSLRSISLDLMYDTESSLRNSTRGLRKAPALDSIEIKGGFISDLYELTRYHKYVKFAGFANLSEGVMRILLHPMRDFRRSRKSIPILKLDLWLEELWIERNPYTVAKFLHMMTTDQTVITIHENDRVEGPGKNWTDHIRSTLADLREEARIMNHAGKPGWRRVKKRTG